MKLLTLQLLWKRVRVSGNAVTISGKVRGKNGKDAKRMDEMRGVDGSKWDGITGRGVDGERGDEEARLREGRQVRQVVSIIPHHSTPGKNRVLTIHVCTH